MKHRQHIIGSLLFVMGSLLLSASVLAKTDPAGQAKQAKATKQTAKQTRDSTADHTKFKALQKDFKDGPEVTRTCLECHTEAAKQVHKTKHWTWEFINPATKRKLGKKNVINNFCTSTKTNQSFCSACHVGYGWKDDSFDFSKEASVDCLVCHEIGRAHV